MKSGKWKELVRREEWEEKNEEKGEFLMSYIVLSLREHTLLSVDVCKDKQVVQHLVLSVPRNMQMQTYLNVFRVLILYCGVVRAGPSTVKF
jgi:hypothetical protein